MYISLNARVWCIDGLGGRATCVIIHPATWQLTHVVVDEKEAPYLKRLVPLELVSFTSPDKLHLICTKSQLATLRPIVEIQDFHQNGNGLHLRYAAAAARNWPQKAASDLPVPINLERLAPEALKIHRNNHVKATNDRMGNVSQFVVNPQTKKITALLVRWKSWWRVNEATIPVAQVDHFEPDLVVLKIGKDHLQKAAVVQLQEPVYTASER